MIRRILAITLFSLAAGSAYGQITADEAIGMIDELPVSRLDPALPNTPFLEWLQGLLGPATKVAWEMNDCGSRTGVPAIDDQRDLAVCMEATVVLSDQHLLGIAIFVGTEKKGKTKRPVVANIYMETDDDTVYFKSLSELQQALTPPKKK